MSDSPRIILWDIETTHNIVATFRLYDKYNSMLPPENILQERYIPCACWKVLGEARVHSVSVLDDPARYKKDPSDDYHVVKTLHDVLSGADVIVAHNGDQFDKPFTEGRMLYHGLKPLPPIANIDTLKVARKRFELNSNKLDYLGTFLKCGRKKPTTNGLWLRILKGDKSAIKEMVTYNKQDVALLERVFLKLRPYMENYINRHLFGKAGCPRCGSLHTQSRGIHRAITMVYQRYQCMTCGGWFRDRKRDSGVTSRVL